MAAISPTIFSDAYSQPKIVLFWMKFHWNLFLRDQLTITSIGYDNGLALIRRQAIIESNADQIHWRIYATPGEDELR